MQQIVSITSQGQITIPASMRRRLALEKNKKAFVKTADNKIIIEPVPSVMDLAGSLKDKALKKKSIEQIIKLEEKAAAKAAAEKYGRQ